MLVPSALGGPGEKVAPPIGQVSTEQLWNPLSRSKGSSMKKVAKTRLVRGFAVKSNLEPILYTCFICFYIYVQLRSNSNPPSGAVSLTLPCSCLFGPCHRQFRPPSRVATPCSGRTRRAKCEADRAVDGGTVFKLGRKKTS